jgi:hypothetical protein
MKHSANAGRRGAASSKGAPARPVAGTAGVAAAEPMEAPAVKGEMGGMAPRGKGVGGWNIRGPVCVLAPAPCRAASGDVDLERPAEMIADNLGEEGDTGSEKEGPDLEVLMKRSSDDLHVGLWCPFLPHLQRMGSRHSRTGCSGDRQRKQSLAEELGEKTRALHRLGWEGEGESRASK